MENNKMEQPNPIDYNFGFGHNDVDLYYKDMRIWSDQKLDELKGSKALRVQNKCLINGHHKLAEKIQEKYWRIMPKTDLAVAWAYTLMPQTKII